jgi:small nuclear ribonucleoprotein (snRNP)-like protein
MHSDVISEYINKDVEVSTSNKTFTGNLKLHDSYKEIVVLSPKQDKYTSRRYGDVVIRQHDIVSVREILPRIEEDYDDDCEDKQMTGQKPYKILSGLFDDIDEGEEEADSSYWKTGNASY